MIIRQLSQQPQVCYFKPTPRIAFSPVKTRTTSKRT